MMLPLNNKNSQRPIPLGRRLGWREQGAVGISKDRCQRDNRGSAYDQQAMMAVMQPVKIALDDCAVEAS